MSTLQQIPDGMRRNWGWLFALGLLFIILGSIGLGMTIALTLVSMMFFGVLLIIGGFSQMMDVFKCKGWRGVVWHALIAVLYIMGGCLVIYDPFLASTFFTGLIAGMLMLIGITRFIMAISLRQSGEWGWLLLAGVLSFILGILILMQWPWSGLWIIGLFIAIELIISGWTYLFMSLAMRKA